MTAMIRSKHANSVLHTTDKSNVNISMVTETHLDSLYNILYIQFHHLFRWLQTQNHA